MKIVASYLVRVHLHQPDDAEDRGRGTEPPTVDDVERAVGIAVGAIDARYVVSTSAERTDD